MSTPPSAIYRALQAWAVARNQSLELLATANSDDDESARNVSKALMRRMTAAEAAVSALLDLHVDEKGRWVK